MLWAETDEDLAFGTSFPTGQLLSIGDCFIKNIDGASPNMVVVKLGMGPASLREDVMWADTSGRVWEGVPCLVTLTC